MENRKKYVILKAMEKGIRAASNEVKTELDSQVRSMFEETGVDRYQINVGDQKATLSVDKTSPKYGLYDEEDALEFMREHGMVKEVIDPAWVDMVSNVKGTVIWNETGEVVPGAYFEPSAFKCIRVAFDGRDGHVNVIQAAMDEGYALDSKTLGLEA